MGKPALRRARDFLRRPQFTKIHLQVEVLEDRTLLSAAGCSGLGAVSGLAADPASASASHILVRFRSPAGPVSPLTGTTIGPAIPLVAGLYEVDLSPGANVNAALAEYQSNPNVLYAQPDNSITVSGGVTPNDPSFGSQWDLNNTGQSGGTPGADIHAPAAWTVTTGSTHTTVAVIDTGIDYDHADLYQNIWINQAEIPLSRLKNLVDVDGDGLITFRDLNDPRNQGPGKITDVNGDGRIDAADILAPMKLDAHGKDTGLGGWAHDSTQDGDTAHPDDLIGWNFVNNTNNPFDDYGHGTHVSGTIGAMGNNGAGVAGINWNIQLMALKFLDSSGSGFDSDAVDAINYAIRHGASISNNSWGGSGNDQALGNAILAARSAGQIFVTAAGNDSSNNDVTPTYPASFHYDNVVSVAASDCNDHLASFSNYGAATVDLAAPGVSILSTTPGNNYGVMSGTSMATPHVTGVLALVWSLHPDWTYREVIDQVLRNVDPLPSFQGKTISGGRLDAAAALNATNPDITFVQQLYVDLLGRQAESGGLNSWANLLAGGASRAQVIQAIWSSPEHRGREVDQFYQTYLHRAEGAAERASWVTFLRGGANENDVISALLNSGEYQAAHPSDQRFILGLYNDVLGRAASWPEQVSWMNALQFGLTRQQLVHIILNSSEGYFQTIQGWYTAFLRRSLGGGEGSSWVNFVQSSQDGLPDVAFTILASGEYFNQAQRLNSH